MRVFLSLIFNEELTYSKEGAIAKIDNSAENVLDELYFRNEIVPKMRTVVDEMMEKSNTKKIE